MLKIRYKSAKHVGLHFKGNSFCEFMFAFQHTESTCLHNVIRSQSFYPFTYLLDNVLFLYLLVNLLLISDLLKEQLWDTL